MGQGSSEDRVGRPQTGSKKVTRPPRLDLGALYAIGCRFGCSDPVVAIVHAPAGCVCWSDPVQALCMAHLLKVQSTGPISIVADYRVAAETTAIDRLRDCAGWNKCPCQGELAALIGEPVT